MASKIHSTYSFVDLKFANSPVKLFYTSLGVGCQSGGARAVSKLKNHQLAAALIRARRGNKTSKIDPAHSTRVELVATHEKKHLLLGPAKSITGPLFIHSPGR
jgi:hypothetical protein